MSILLGVGGLLIGGVAGFFGYKKTLTEKAIKFKERIARVKEIEEELLEDAKKKSEEVLANAEKKAEKIEEQRLAKMEEIQNRLLDREEKMEQRLEKLEEFIEGDANNPVEKIIVSGEKESHLNNLAQIEGCKELLAKINKLFEDKDVEDVEASAGISIVK